MVKKRNYDSEYKNYQGSEKQKHNRALRNAARREMMKDGKVRKGDGNDVDHIHGIQDGNKSANLRVQAKSENRSYPRSSSGKDLELTKRKPKKRK
jgi:hypothetical protein